MGAGEPTYLSQKEIKHAPKFPSRVYSWVIIICNFPFHVTSSVKELSIWIRIERACSATVQLVWTALHGITKTHHDFMFLWVTLPLYQTEQLMADNANIHITSIT